MGLLKIAKKTAAAVAATNGECTVCGKTIRGGKRKGNVCSQACAHFWAMNL